MLKQGTTLRHGSISKYNVNNLQINYYIPFCFRLFSCFFIAITRLKKYASYISHNYINLKYLNVSLLSGLFKK